ncbi:hypothetical protein U6O17_12410, partial [Cutibacterium acnes]
MAQTFLTAAEIVELVAAYEAGETLRRLGKQFHIHRLTATAHLARRGVPVRQRSLGSVQNKGGRPGLPSRLHARATGPPVRGGRADHASNHHTT